MAYKNLTELFTAIANSIRGKTGGTEQIVANDFPSAIDRITGGEDLTTELTEQEAIISELSAILDGKAAGADALKYIEGQHEFVDLSNATSIKTCAFYSDTVITDISMPNVTSIGDYAFNQCANLALTSLPAGLTSIGSGAFQLCRNLALTSLPAGLTSIGNSAFRYCTKLALTSLPAGLTSIGEMAFEYCQNLALTSLPAGLTSIGNSAFRYCTKIALTSLPAGLTSIGEMAFAACTNLTTLTFEGTPTSIGLDALVGCLNLTVINVPWAEGEVDGSPWGATEATINYNYKG